MLPFRQKGEKLKYFEQYFLKLGLSYVNFQPHTSTNDIHRPKYIPQRRPMTDSKWHKAKVNIKLRIDCKLNFHAYK